MYQNALKLKSMDEGGKYKPVGIHTFFPNLAKDE